MSHYDNYQERMDMSVSPSTSTQCPENLSPIPTMKTLYSKTISSRSSSQQTEDMSISMTPENKYRTGSPFVIRKAPFNPFNQNLKERLENSVFSPNVFSTVISPSQDSETFKWTIDDLSKINPAPIEEDAHFEEHVDEQTELEIQNTIDKYFTETQMPSPWDCKLPTSWHSLREIFKAEGTMCSDVHSNVTVASSPYSFSLSRLEIVSKDSLGSFQDVSTQTALSLPPDLPEPINAALKPYFTEQNTDDINLSINSLRRKLFFHQEDEALSPVRFCSSLNGSPRLPRYCPSTPLPQSRTEGTPIQTFSPIDLSPIGSYCDKPCNSTSNKIRTETPLRAIENKQCLDLKLKETPNTKRFSQECFKVFESPKQTGQNRRARKRRRSASETNVSVSYSSFLKHKIPTIKRSFGESRILVDHSTDVLAESQDTGYQTESANFNTFAEKNLSNSNVKSLALECWKKENKENRMIASTPTK